MMRDYKLFVLDFDHTALGGEEPYDRFPDAFSNFLDELDEMGVMWATNTTWGACGQDRLFRKSRLLSRPVRLLGRTGLHCGLYLDGRVVLDAAWDEWIAGEQWRYSREVIPPLLERLATDAGISLGTPTSDQQYPIRWITPPDASAIAGLEAILGGSFYYQAGSDGREGTLFPAFMSKGVALRRIQEEMGISAARTIVAGDGINDLPMFQPSLAGAMIAPANAHPLICRQVHLHGGIVSRKNFSEGVVDAVHSLASRGSSQAGAPDCLTKADPEEDEAQICATFHTR